VLRAIFRASWLSRLLFAAYFVEVGLLLLVAPWSMSWERNFFAVASPVVAVVVRNSYLRGAVSGLGLVSVATGVAELFALLASWRR
jgi:hypothetical protein